MSDTKYEVMMKEDGWDLTGDKVYIAKQAGDVSDWWLILADDIGDEQTVRSSEIEIIREVPEEPTVKTEHKFKVGDKVKVVATGYGFKWSGSGGVYTVVELGYYNDKLGYKVKDSAGQIHENECFNDFVSEKSFELVEEALPLDGSIAHQEIINNNTSALDVQEGGNHYKNCGIQPVEYIHANDLDYLQGNVIKYTTRHKSKNGKEDIKKAIHYLQLILELQYGE